MQQILLIIVSLIACVAVFSGCQNQPGSHTTTANGNNTDSVSLSLGDADASSWSASSDSRDIILWSEQTDREQRELEDVSEYGNEEPESAAIDNDAELEEQMPSPNKEIEYEMVEVIAPVDVKEGKKSNFSNFWPNGNSTVEDKNDPDPDVNELYAVSSVPEAVNLQTIKSEITIPPDCKREGIKGRVFIKLLIDRGGKPKSYVVYQTPDIRLAKAVIQKLGYVKYRPALLNGKPVKHWVNVDYEFQ